MSATLSALQARANDFTALRRDIHQHPEIGFQEFRTSDLVAERLKQWGYEVTRGLGGTGVVGTLKRGSSERKLGIRADMDALPIQEATGAEWASTRQGLMHAIREIENRGGALVPLRQTIARFGERPSIFDPNR